MAERPRNVLICSCDETMPLDARALRRACRDHKIESAHQLCRRELETFRKAIDGGGPLTVACTQEAPLFSEVGEDADIRFVNIRETAGWSKDAKAAGPKIAALIAEAQQALPAGASLQVDLYGGNDPSGSAETNAALRAARARHLERALRAHAELRVTYQSHIDSPPALATIRSRAAMAQLRFE